MWYNNTKYSKWYFSIIEKCRTTVYDTYTEKHHIIPKSLSGTDDSDNLIVVSYREHFILHRLLPKMVLTEDAKRKMLCALSMMRRKSKFVKINSRQFHIMRMAVKHAMIGRKLKEETKEKLRQIRADQMNDETYIVRWKESLKKRPTQTKESIKKRNESKKSNLLKTRGVINVSQLPEVKQKISAKLKNRVFTEDHKRRISESKLEKSYESNPMNTEEGRRKVSESKIGNKILCKNGMRKYAKPNTEKWNHLLLDGWTPKDDGVTTSGA